MKRLAGIAMMIVFCFCAKAQQHSYAQDVATTAMVLWKDSFLLPGDKAPKWRYDQGVILKGIEGIWNSTGEGKWFTYIQKSMDYYVQEDGTIKGYKPDEYNIDHLNNGKLILLLYEVTGKEKYKKAAQLLRSQLTTHPRTTEGGFWHKKIYPSQMWLDGLYMGQPFYAAYAKVFGEDAAFNDITRQFVLMEKRARDPKTGLLYHGWDESRKQAWADKKTGLSPNVWGRALGWYGMAMVDALDYFPANHPGRDSIINILNRFAKAVANVQDRASGLWYDVPNLPDDPRNYPEASASSMLVYTLAKGIRKGYLPDSYLSNAQKGYNGIIKKFITVKDGLTSLQGTVAVSGLGGNPYRDGSFSYYMSEPVVENDPKGMGAFINAANEMEMVPTLSIGRGKKVMLDNYFNNEWKNDGTGRLIPWHYTWDDKSNGGFAMLGDIYQSFGACIRTLKEAPTKKNLKNTSVFIIVDPDTEKETKKPNLPSASAVDAIRDWVHNGGTLVLMGNDAGNTNLESANLLAKPFGIQFNEDNVNMVKDNVFDEGLVLVPDAHSIFINSKRLFIKELATLRTSGNAQPILTKEGNTVMAVARWGKGVVFAVGDPWLYNEYIDGRKLPPHFDNFKAAQDLARWTLMQNAKR